MDAMELVYACVFCSSADMEGERERDEDPEAVKEDGVDMGKPWLGGGRGFTVRGNGHFKKHVTCVARAKMSAAGRRKQQKQHAIM